MNLNLFALICLQLVLLQDPEQAKIFDHKSNKKVFKVKNEELQYNAQQYANMLMWQTDFVNV